MPLLKRIDVLVRENSSVRHSEILHILDSMLNNIENKEENVLAYAFVADAKYKEVYLYYSLKASRYYHMLSRKIIIVDSNYVTKDNFMSNILENIKDIAVNVFNYIVNFIRNPKIVKEILSIENNQIRVNNKIVGDVINVEVFTQKGIEKPEFTNNENVIFLEEQYEDGTQAEVIYMI